MESAALGQETLSDEKLSELLDLLKEVDGVEFKLTVPENDQFSSAAALELDPLDAQLRQIYFFDTPDLTLKTHGVVVRARRVQQDTDDTVVKLRPVFPDQLPDELRKSGDFKVEIDAMPSGFICSGSLKGQLGSKEVQAAVAGKAEIESLFSKEQRDFYDAYAPKGLEFNDLSILGPILVHKYEFSPKGFSRELEAELWLFPDGARMLELSTSCAPPEIFTAAAETRAFVTERGIALGGKQQTKTNKALELFSKRLQAADDASGRSRAKSSGKGRD
jgi:hypothetical protein